MLLSRLHLNRNTAWMRAGYSFASPRQDQAATLPDSLRIAVVSDDRESVSAWLAQGNDVNARHAVHGETMLMMAASRGHVNMVAALLLQPLCNVNLKTTKKVAGCFVTAVVAAAVAGHSEVVSTLLNAGANLQNLFNVLDIARADGEWSDAQHQEIYNHCCACCRKGCICCSEGNCHCQPT